MAQVSKRFLTIILVMEMESANVDACCLTLAIEQYKEKTSFFIQIKDLSETRIKMVTEAGHYPHHECPDETADEIIQFLNQIQMKTYQ